jgi:methyl-accepting chemotaxis protein
MEGFMFKNLKIGAKLIGAFSMVALICGIVGIIGYYAIGQTSHSIEEIADVQMPSMKNLMVISEEAYQIEGCIKALCNPSLTHEEIEAELRKIADARVVYEKAWTEYEELPQTAEQRALWQKFEEAWNKWRDDNNKFMRMRDELIATDIENPTKFRRLIEGFAKDHHAHMSNLASAIMDGRDFHGHTDPSECTFGKWLSEFQTDNRKLSAYLNEIGKYHDDFHYKSGDVARLLRESKTENSLKRAENIYKNEIMPAAEETFALFGKVNNEIARAESLLHDMQIQAMEVNSHSAGEAIGLLAQIVDSSDTLGHKVAEDAKAIAGRMNGMIIASIIIGVLLALGFGILISRAISRPVSHISDAARDIAQGDINKQIEYESKDELGVLADSFRGLIHYMQEMADVASNIAEGDLTINVNAKSHKDILGTAFSRMVGNLEEVVRNLTDNTTQLVSAATEISSASEQMAAGAKQQTGQTSQAATAVEEMTSTIMESSKNSGEASELAKSAAESSTQGSQVVSDTISGMNRISQVVQESADTIQKLAQSADQIGEIISVIDDIADQTNLLALNAAIEAARAGEQGRGFAVVADEVRKLAERTGKATKEIADMIKGIQSDTTGAVSSMEQGIKEVESGKELADKAGNSLNEILQQSQSVMDMIQQIATASEEQSAASEEISRSVANISSVTKENAAGAEQSASAAEQLNRQAEDLRGLVGKFKVRGGNLGIIDLAKTDHMHYVKKLEDIIEGRKSADSWKITDHRTCRCGQWYYSDGAREYGSLSEFKAVEDPHIRVHKYANDAVKHFNSNNTDQAKKCLNDTIQASHDVIDDLEKLKHAIMAHA